MIRPIVKRGLDERAAALIAVLMLCVGCVAQTSTNPANPKKQGASTLGDVCYESLQERDRIRAVKLRALKGTRYDSKRQAAIEQAGAEASAESWKPVAAALSKRLDRVDQNDQAAFDAVLEELAAASERAGK